MPAGRSKHDGPDMDVKSVDGLDKVLRDLLRFLSAPISRELDNPQWYQIMTVFEAWDAAGDVDRAEFVHGMAVLGIELDTPEVESVFATFGRGSSGMLDVSELSAALSTHKDKQEAEDKEKPEPGRVRRSSKLVGQAVKQVLPPPHPQPPPTLPSALWPRWLTCGAFGWWRWQASKSLVQAPTAKKLTEKELASATAMLKKAVRLNHVKARDHIVQSR